MNINKKYIIIFGTLILLLVLITGGITYYNEKKEQTQIPDAKESLLGFSKNYPINLSELSKFLLLCHDVVHNAVFSDAEGLENNKIKQIVCLLTKDKSEKGSSDFYFPFFTPLEAILSFKSDSYIGISIDFEDVVREYDSSLLERDKLYFCSISEPSLTDPLSSEMKQKQTLIFNEGDVSCIGVVNTDIPLVMYFYGFVPQAESLNIKQYLVEEQTVSEVMNKQSFSEIKEILKDYPVIWQMEKPITP